MISQHLRACTAALALLAIFTAPAVAAGFNATTDCTDSTSIQVIAVNALNPNPCLALAAYYQLVLYVFHLQLVTPPCLDRPSQCCCVPHSL